MDSGRLENNSQMNRRIMVVDDDSSLRGILEEILTDEGWDVVSAKDGYQAVEMASEFGINLFLMDISMPGMNGVDAFLAIKERRPNCVTVMMTGFAENDLVQKALSSGVTTVLYKPLSIEDLLAILDKAVPESFPF